MTKKKFKDNGDGTGEFDGHTWKIEHTETSFAGRTSYVRDGVVYNEYISKVGHPTEIHKLLKGKKYKAHYAFNIKKLSRETLNKDDMLKYRVEASFQAYGIDGEGEIYDPNKEPATKVSAEGEGVIDTDAARAKQKWKEMSTKTKMLVVAAYTGIALACGAAIIWLVGLLRK